MGAKRHYKKGQRMGLYRSKNPIHCPKNPYFLAISRKFRFESKPVYSSIGRKTAEGLYSQSISL